MTTATLSYNRKRALRERFADDPGGIERQREAWEIACRMSGKDPAQEMARFQADDGAKRAAWTAKKRSMGRA